MTEQGEGSDLRDMKVHWVLMVILEWFEYIRMKDMFECAWSKLGFDSKVCGNVWCLQQRFYSVI